MRISHKHKFIFIHGMKTGGTSIRECLNDYSDIISTPERHSPYWNHLSPKDLEKHFQEQQWDWDEYFKFVFVRNPWDRMVSLYHHLLWKSLQPQHDWARRCLGGSDSFITYLKSGKLCPEQTKYFNNISDFYVGRFENIQEDFNVICDKIGIPQQKLPYTNKSNHKHYTEYYNDETIEMVSDKYDVEIKMFDYKFGE